MAAELVTLTDGTNSVDFLDGEGAETGYVKEMIEGLDPPPCEVRYSGNKPIYRKWGNREITITFGIKASSAADLTSKKRTLITILENTYRHWTSEGKRGAKAQFQYRRPGGTNISYMDVYWAECDWGAAESQAAAPYVYKLMGAQLTLACEPCFHPLNLITIGPNLGSNASFEEWNNGVSDAQPDEWGDYENITGGTGSNNRESTEIKEGSYALKTVADTISNGNYKGVYQDIISRVDAGTEYTLVAWIKNAAIANGVVRICSYGDDLLFTYALNSGAANSGYTQYSCQFTPTAGDTKLWIMAFIQATSASCSGTVYIDKMMIIEGSSVPDEWSGCGYIYDSYSVADPGYVNFIDVTGIQGDLDAKCNIKIEPTTTFVGADIDKFWIAMVGPRANIQHWGEVDMSYDDTRSNDSKYVHSDASGSSWLAPSSAYIMTLSTSQWQAMAGRTWRVLAGLYATATTLQWRLKAALREWGADQIDICTGKAKYHPEANQWCVVDLGPLYLSHPMVGDYSSDTLYIGYEYNPNGVSTTVQADFICLVPENEYAIHIDKDLASLFNYIYRSPKSRLYIKEAADFPHHVFTESYTGPENIGCLGSHQRGTYPRLVPGEDNRIIFLFAEDGCRHNIARQFKVTLSYLPQFLTPLE